MEEGPVSLFYKSKAGILELIGKAGYIEEIRFVDKMVENRNREIPGFLQECYNQLDEYFNFKREEFTIGIKLTGTDFQQLVWRELLKIPFGKTISYLELAERLGDPKVIRAAASANGKNKIAIVVPCHRVIGADGKLVGYAGGLERKRRLLEHERGELELNLF